LISTGVEDKQIQLIVMGIRRVATVRYKNSRSTTTLTFIQINY